MQKIFSKKKSTQYNAQVVLQVDLAANESDESHMQISPEIKKDIKLKETKQKVQKKVRPEVEVIQTPKVTDTKSLNTIIQKNHKLFVGRKSPLLQLNSSSDKENNYSY